MRHRHPPWIPVGLWAALVLPLVVAVIALRSTTWFPVLDLAMTELRVRDVGGPHTPLIGLPGRIGSFPDQGSHPGPLSFYALAPAYRLLGSTAWALQASTAILNGAAVALAVWMGWRRRAAVGAAAVAAVLALLMGGYGIETLVEPWNPYLPLLWWLVTLLAAWGILDGDTPMLVVVGLAGSMAAQTHVPYLGSALGVGALAVAVVVGRAVQRPAQRARATVWTGVTVASLAVVWAPVVIDELTRSPGNLTVLRQHFLSPPEAPVGLATGVRLALLHLDVWSFWAAGGGATGSLVAASSDPSGSVIPGAVVLALWALAVLGAWRLRHRSLLALHAVVAWGLVLVTFSLGRIFGKLWYYLMLSAWAVSVLLLLAVAWTAVAVVRARSERWRHRLDVRAITTALVAVTVASSLWFAATARSVQPPAPRLSLTLSHVVPDGVAQLERRLGPEGARRGRYLVTWEDAFYIGSQGYGVVNELERRGFRVGVPEAWRVPVTAHRVLSPDDATARLHFATGPFIEVWRSRSDAIELSSFDPRTPAEQREFASLQAKTAEALVASGRADLLSDLRGNLFGATLDPRLPDGLRTDMERMLALGMPGALFLTTSPP